MGFCPCFSVVWLGLKPSPCSFSKIQTRWPRAGKHSLCLCGRRGCLVQIPGSWLIRLMTLGNWNYGLWKGKDHLCCSLYTVDFVCSCMNGYLAGMWSGKKYLLALWEEESQHIDRRRLWGGSGCIPSPGKGCSHWDLSSAQHPQCIWDMWISKSASVWTSVN